jgi:hypothetical protein
MQAIEFPKVVFMIEPFIVNRGGLIDGGLLSENHHKTSLIIREDLVLNEGVVFFL